MDLEKEIRDRVKGEEYKGARVCSLCSFIGHNFVAIEDLKNNPNRWINAFKESNEIS